MDRGIQEELLRVLGQPVSEFADYSCLDNMPMEERAKLTKLDVFYMRLVEKALHGDMKAMQEIIDRLHGKAPQTVHNVNENHNYVHYLQEIQDAEFSDPTPGLPAPKTLDVEVEEDSEDDYDLLGDLGL